MKIFSDLHHFDLYYSFQLLFEKRLGHELYRPIGRDWRDYGYWHISSAEEAITGYLSTDHDEVQNLLLQYWHARDASWARNALDILRTGEINETTTGVFSIVDRSKDVLQKGITLQEFINTKFDIIISSVPQHFAIYEKLRKKFQPQAKHIFHMGPGNVDWKVPLGALNIMVHTAPLHIPSYVNAVYYNQEFDLNTFSYATPTSNKKITSYVHFPESEDLWSSLGLDEKFDFSFVGKTLGSLGDIVIKTEDLATKIKESMFIWHIKPGGESYGHILHNALACGRPLIINADDFAYKRAGRLLRDMETCINSSGCSADELAAKILKVSESSLYEEMCSNAFHTFKSFVDFDKDEKEISKFLEKLI